MIHIYCGDGKGKTTAAVGLAVRCAGAGGTVLFYQFMKPETSSERIALQQIHGITVLSGYSIHQFSFWMTPEEKVSCYWLSKTVVHTIRADKSNYLPNVDFRRIVILHFDGIFAIGNGFKWHGTAAKKTGSGDYRQKSR